MWKIRQNYQPFKRKVESRRNDYTMQFISADVINPARHRIAACDGLSLSVRINLFPQRSQRVVLAKGWKTAVLVRSALFVAAPSKRSLIQHFYEGGQNPFRTIRRLPPLPPQGREWVKRTLSDRALTIALEIESRQIPRFKPMRSLRQDAE